MTADVYDLGILDAGTYLLDVDGYNQGFFKFILRNHNSTEFGVLLIQAG